MRKSKKAITVRILPEVVAATSGALRICIQLLQPRAFKGGKKSVREGTAGLGSGRVVDFEAPPSDTRLRSDVLSLGVSD